jgi:dTDP-glucose 4,6-dehydratase
VGESDTAGPDPLDPDSAYGGAKRLAETWCASTTKDGQVEAVIARPFSFVGPRLPLDQHFAAGNFLADLLAGRSIRVMGDGRAIRSYLYAGELAEWLLTILSRGIAGRAYNVGSSDAVTIADVAHRISRLSDPALQVEVNGSATAGAPHRYVPDVTLAAKELGLQQRIPLDEALVRWRDWLALGGASV